MTYKYETSSQKNETTRPTHFWSRLRDSFIRWSARHFNSIKNTNRWKFKLFWSNNYFILFFCSLRQMLIKCFVFFYFVLYCRFVDEWRANVLSSSSDKNWSNKFENAFVKTNSSRAFANRVEKLSRIESFLFYGFTILHWIGSQLNIKGKIRVQTMQQSKPIEN